MPQEGTLPLSKMSQTEKDKCHVLSLISNLYSEKGHESRDHLERGGRGELERTVQSKHTTAVYTHTEISPLNPLFCIINANIKINERVTVLETLCSTDEAPWSL